MNSNPTQNQRILAYLDAHESITQIEALNALGIMRLASRISDLRKKGFPITSELVEVRNRYGETCRVKRYRMQREWVDG